MFTGVFYIERRVTHAVHWLFRFLEPIVRDFPLQILLVPFSRNRIRVFQLEHDLNDVYWRLCNQGRLICSLGLTMFHPQFRLIPNRIADCIGIRANTTPTSEFARTDGEGNRTHKLALSRRVHAYPTVAANVAIPATTKLKSLIGIIRDILEIRCMKDETSAVAVSTSEICPWLHKS